MRWVRKSTDYGIGGASFLIMGCSMIGGLILNAADRPVPPMPAYAFATYAGVGALLADIGAYWLHRAMGFYREERAAAGLPPSVW